MEITLPNRVLQQYKHNFMVRVPVYDAYVEELEIESKIEIDRVYSCLDCNDLGENEYGDICICKRDWAAEPNKD